MTEIGRYSRLSQRNLGKVIECREISWDKIHLVFKTDNHAVRLMDPPAGVMGDLHSLVSAPCRAHIKKS